MMPHTVAALRMAIALLQGVVLYWLYEALDTKTWPATDGFVFAPILAMAIFVPILAVSGLGVLRPLTLGVWLLVATLMCAGLAYYDIYREPLWNMGSDKNIVPSPLVWTALVYLLFINHSLITAGDADRRVIATYPRLFETAWKHGLQVFLASLFTGIFWLLLLLGDQLFLLINIKTLHDIIRESWFAIPATTLAFAAALHFTDVQANLVQGARTLVLTLFAWLLPMMILLAGAFLLTLPFTGLTPLWNTGSATGLLFGAAAVLILLINTAYQDGQPEHRPHAILRIANVIAAGVLVPITALAVYALYLRVSQYGWTPERIFATAGLILAGCHTVGYAVAALFSGPALRGLGFTNVVTAGIAVVIGLALFTPVADPARISVDDQIRRLDAGLVTPDTFDFKFLKFEAGRYGREALADLAKRTEGPEAAKIAEKATLTLALKNRWDSAPQVEATPENRAKNITVVHPVGQTLPESFLRQDWKRIEGGPWFSCLVESKTCDAALLDVTGDGTTEIVLVSTPYGRRAVFQVGADGLWREVGELVALCRKKSPDETGAQDYAIAPSKFAHILLKGERFGISEPSCQ